MTPGALAVQERVRPPSKARVVASLVDLGLVVRTAHPADGRQILERKASIEVIEVIGSDRSACRLIEEWLPIQEADGVRPG